MKVMAKAGTLITDLLFQYLGQDNDQIEHAFYRLNPHVRREVFLIDTEVILSDVELTPKTQHVTKSWD
ncbi:hypothetical protein [Photobacterium damselae]|uniref:hypothetical protein n=1 Tax=Photobacterium damselae TaxID=38293 RepID=UPI003B6818EE